MAPVNSSRRLNGTLLALALVAAAAVADFATARGVHTVAARHELWMAKFGRAYADAEEKLSRQEVFAANAQHVDAVNRAGDRTYTLGLNQFSDLTDDEFLEMHLGYRHHTSAARTRRRWQRCWAFAAVAATEGLVKIATGDLISMSEQQNQWGTGWGEAGYMRLSRGNGANCGIATYAYYPTMDS
ncbi:Fruit bromelain [Triticum urartu]|uniref:Fruit bromelain n=1 Tax=Triticum urartu TaxID=4572 RepID=M7ZH06_TRIUA|nr:Fruit bromelain [Triticum urartu]